MAIAKFAEIGDKLSGIQGKLDGISDAFENPVAGFAENLLGGFDFGGELPGAISNLVGNIPSFPGLNLGFSGLGGFGDCFRNLDDLIVDMMKEKLLELSLSIPGGIAAASLMAAVQEATEVIQEVVDDIISLSQESLMDLIIRVQNSSFLQRIIIIKQITDLYGDIICNLNDLISKILDLDPCNLLDELAGTGAPAGPKPLPTPEAPMPPYPTIIDPATNNATLLSIKDNFINAKFQVGQALSKTNNDDPEVPPFVQSTAHNAALSTLHHLAHSFRNQIRSLGPGQGSTALRNIEESSQRIVREKSKEWSKDALEFFEKRFNNLLKPALEESATSFEQFDTATVDPVAASNLPVESLERTLVEAPEDKCGTGEVPEGTDANGMIEAPKHVSDAPRETFVMEAPPDIYSDLPQTIVIPQEGSYPGTYSRLQGNMYKRAGGSTTRDDGWIVPGTISYDSLQLDLEVATRIQNNTKAPAGLPNPPRKVIWVK